jgi:hypothetical protein
MQPMFLGQQSCLADKPTSNSSFPRNLTRTLALKKQIDDLAHHNPLHCLPLRHPCVPFLVGKTRKGHSRGAQQKKSGVVVYLGMGLRKVSSLIWE